MRRSPLAGLALLAAGLLLAVPTAPRADLAEHGGPVRAIAVAPDGRLAVTGGFDYSVIVWDLRAQEPRHRLFGHEAAVNAVALAPRRGLAVSAGDDGVVAVWDLAAGRLVRRLRADAKLAALAVAPDEGVVAAGGWDGRIHRWRLADGAALPALEGTGERFTSLAFSRDGRHLYAGDHEGGLHVWGAADGRPIARFAPHDFALTALVPVPGRGVATGGVDRTVALLALPEGRELAALEGHDAPVLSLAAASDGRRLASGDSEGLLHLWDMEVGGAARVLRAHEGPVWALAFSPDGARLYSAGADGVVRIWDPAAGKAVGALADGGDVAALPAAAEMPRGAELFRKCAACHTVGEDGGNRAGPTLHGLFGRRAGSVPGYPYSEALAGSDIVWTERTVSRLFEIGPDRMTPGSKMPLQRMPDPRDRAELIAYLKRVTEPDAQRTGEGSKR